MRLLVWLALGLLVYLALRSRFLRRRSQFGSDRSAQPAQPAEPTKRSASSAETMVACSYCQIYLPASEAITHSSRASPPHYFCCEEHATLYAASGETSSRPKE